MNILKLICYVYIFFSIGSFHLPEVPSPLMSPESRLDLEDPKKTNLDN